MADILNLPGLAAVSHETTIDECRITAESRLKPTQCPECKSFQLHRHGVREQEYADAPNYGLRTVILLRRRRWRCQMCTTLFPDPLPDMDEKRRATDRLIRYVRKKCFSHTFSEIAREVGLTDKTIRAIFDDYVSEFESKVKFETPRVLGIDEVKIIGKYRCILTNIEKNAVYDLLPSRAMKDLRAYFKHFPDPKEVEVFTADLWNNYATVAREFFPHATFVADRFHVQRMATNAMEAIRKQVRKGLERKERLRLKDDRHILLMNGHKLSERQQALVDDWSTAYPALGDAYRVKEAFVAVWEHEDRQEAGEALDAWVRSVPDSMVKPFRELINVATTRREHILNYFDHRITNAYTESINRLAKSINRMGRGYTLEVVRAKLIYDTNARKNTAKRVPIYGDAAGPGDATMGRFGFQTREKQVIGHKVVEYGPHIPTLCDLLESGYFEEPAVGLAEEVG